MRLLFYLAISASFLGKSFTSDDMPKQLQASTSRHRLEPRCFSSGVKKSTITCPREYSHIETNILREAVWYFCMYNNFDDNLIKNQSFDVWGDEMPRNGITNKLKRRCVDGNMWCDGSEWQIRPNKQRYAQASRTMFQDYELMFTWIPSDGPCLFNNTAFSDDRCITAYRRMALTEPCGVNSSPGNRKNRIAVNATINIGCGEYKWKVIEHMPKLGPQVCNKPRKHKPLPVDLVKAKCKVFCNWLRKVTMKPGCQSLEWGRPELDRVVFKVSWIDGCYGLPQKPLNPAPGISCQDMCATHVDNCHNNEVGGWRDIGCLRWEYWQHW